jgi:hypothetical protein
VLPEGVLARVRVDPEGCCLRDFHEPWLVQTPRVRIWS